MRIWWDLDRILRSHLLFLSSSSLPQPGKRRMRTTWRTCSAGRWKPCKCSIRHITPASERKGTRGKRMDWWDVVSECFCVSEKSGLSTLCVTLQNKKSNNAVVFLFLFPFRDPQGAQYKWVREGLLYWTKSPNIFTLNFNAALCGPCRVPCWWPQISCCRVVL